MGATMSGSDVTTADYHLYPLGEIGLFLPVRPLQELSSTGDCMK